MKIKKFITSLLSIIILSNFVCNVSLATESQNSKNLSETQEENITLREQKIKVLKDLKEKTDKLYSDNIKALENMSDANYNYNLKIIKIAKYIGYAIAGALCGVIFYASTLGIKGFDTLSNKIKSLGYKKGFEEWFAKSSSIHKNRFIRSIAGSVICPSNFSTFLNKVLITFNPYNSAGFEKFDDIKEIYYDANNLYDELKK